MGWRDGGRGGRGGIDMEIEYGENEKRWKCEKSAAETEVEV